MGPIRRLHHAQITIPHGAEAAGKAFYCGLLGLPEVDKPESLRGRGGFWLQVGPQQVHVGTEEGVGRANSKAHLAYEVDDVHEWERRLRAHGVEIGDSVPIPGFARFEFRDPFGNRVELLSGSRRKYRQILGVPASSGQGASER